MYDTDDEIRKSDVFKLNKIGKIDEKISLSVLINVLNNNHYDIMVLSFYLSLYLKIGDGFNLFIFGLNEIGLNNIYKLGDVKWV